MRGLRPELPLGPLFEERIEALRRLGAHTGRDVLGRAVTEYLQRSRALFEAMKVALDRGNGDALAQGAHDLAGSSGMLGAGRLVDLLRALETAASSGELEGLGAVLRAANKAYERFAVALRESR